jgi:hypothetical protein
MLKPHALPNCKWHLFKQFWKDISQEREVNVAVETWRQNVRPNQPFPNNAGPHVDSEMFLVTSG